MDLITFFNREQFNVDLNLYCCGSQKCPSHQSFGPSVRDDYLFHYVTKGKGLFIIKNKKYYLKAHDFFFIPPNEKVFYKPDKDNPWEYTWISFIGTKGDEIISKTSINASNPIFTYDSDNKLIHCMNEIIDASLKNNETTDFLLMSLLYKFLHILTIDFPSKEYKLKETSKQKYLEIALSYINVRYKSNISTLDIAKHTNIDKSYLHKIFKENLNTTPKQYLINLRLSKACNLLRNQNLSIGDVARSVGYEDVLVFSKTFKKSKGCTATEFRNL